MGSNIRQHQFSRPVSKRKSFMAWMLAITIFLVIVSLAFVLEAAFLWFVLGLVGFEISFKACVGVSLLISFGIWCLKAVFN